MLFDGAGGEAAGVVTGGGRLGLTVEVGEVVRHPPDSPIELTLAVAMGKSHRQSYVIEKCTELGVAAIWPMLTSRSVAKPGAPVVEKWTRRAIEAAKQSHRRWVPRIEPLRPLDDIIPLFSQFDMVAVADTSHEPADLDTALAGVATEASLLALVGPEGGWGADELGRIHEAGGIGVRLAPTILRTETAAVAICAAVALRGLRPGSS